jgi:hypothetical protein
MQTVRRVAMGSAVGTFTDEEVENLSPENRDQLKQAALQELRNNPDIRRIIEEDPTILTTNPDINEILREKLNPIREGFEPG